MPLRIVTLCCSLLLALPGHARQADHLAGPVMARLVEVMDGDTIRVKAKIWLGQELNIDVRLVDIDTPEIGRAACKTEKQRGIEAKIYLARLIGDSPLALRDIRHDKYAGRGLAHVLTRDWLDLSDHLLKQKIARPYKRGGHDWCSGQ